MKAKTFVFEIKSQKEYNYTNKRLGTLRDMNLERTEGKKLQHLKRQYDFIENVKCAGGYGGFVYSIDQVKEIIENAFKMGNS